MADKKSLKQYIFHILLLIFILFDLDDGVWNYF